MLGHCFDIAQKAAKAKDNNESTCNESDGYSIGNLIPHLARRASASSITLMIWEAGI